MIWFQLFLSFLQIGLFSFGGGYAAMPLIQEQIVNIHGWLDMDQFTDLITISQMTPGPIAINSATFVGIRIGGIPGALVATLGCILPSCIIVTLLAKLYLKYQKLDVLQSVLNSLRPAVVALIASAGISILVTSFVRFLLSGRFLRRLRAAAMRPHWTKYSKAPRGGQGRIPKSAPDSSRSSILARGMQAL